MTSAASNLRLCGGIGTGTFFELNGEHTLGREESRSGHFLDPRDYCKLHIISHYVKALLGSSFMTMPIGRVGNDKQGLRLLQEMVAAGLDPRYVEIIDGGKRCFHSVLYIRMVTAEISRLIIRSMPPLMPLM